MILAITGMHRSGTSLVASWLQACGLVLDNGRVVPPYPDNPLGFFEDADFVDLHAISIRRRSRWSAGWKLASRHPLGFSIPEREIAERLIKQRSDVFPVWGWKDPRTVLFLHQWKRLIPSLKVIICWRSPEEVVFSLLNRWRISGTRYHYLDPIWAINMWKAYNSVAVQYFKNHGNDTIIFSINKLIDNDYFTFININKKFGNKLEYKDFNTLYRSDMLNNGSTFYWIRILCLIFKCKNLERIIDENSLKN